MGVVTSWKRMKREERKREQERCWSDIDEQSVKQESERKRDTSFEEAQLFEPSYLVVYTRVNEKRENNLKIHPNIFK